MVAGPREPAFYWTKVWGRPREPAGEALLFNSEATRDAAVSILTPGDIVVYLTSDAAQAERSMRGRVAGAVEIHGEPVLAEALGIVERARPEDFREDGRFRWPYGITISRAWRALDAEANDNLIPGHKDLGIQSAATIHPMRPDEVARFKMLRVVERTEDGDSDRLPFASSLYRPWHQHEGYREGGEVAPGSDVYVAVISDAFGMTFKVGSGKVEERLTELNRYRRPSQGETIWKKILSYSFRTPEAARAAEDHILVEAHRGGFWSRDHSEFLVGIDFNQVKGLFNAAVKVGKEREMAPGVGSDVVSDEVPLPRGGSAPSTR